jgi:hypothetical protein
MGVLTAFQYFDSPGRDFKEGRRIGELSFALYEKFGSKSWLARLSVLYYDFVHGWFYPLDSCRDPLEYARQTALDTGDFEFALGCEMVSFYNRLEFDTIDALTSQLDQLKRRIDLYGHSSAVVLTVAPRQLMENLTNMESKHPHMLEGSFTDATYAGMIASNFLFNAWGELQSTLLCILFGRYEEVAAHSKNCRVLASNSFGPHCGGFNFLLCGLADVACARNMRSRRAAYAKRCSKLLRYSADHGEGLYFLSKHYLLEAELAALAGKTTLAFTLYLSAVSSSEKARLRIQTALANERMARFLWEQRDVPRARPFFKESLVWYKDWGAIVKVRHLEQEMCEYGIDLSEPASMATPHSMDYPCVYKGL